MVSPAAPCSGRRTRTARRQTPALGQRQPEGPALTRRDANGKAERHQHQPLEHHQADHQGRDQQRVLGKQPEVDAGAHRHEEEAEQQPLERFYVCLQLVAIFAVRQHHAGEEGAKGGERPTDSISTAMAITSSRAAATKISRMWDWAMARNTGRIR